MWACWWVGSPQTWDKEMGHSNCTLMSFLAPGIVNETNVCTHGLHTWRLQWQTSSWNATFFELKLWNATFFELKFTLGSQHLAQRTGGSSTAFPCSAWQLLPAPDNTCSHLKKRRVKQLCQSSLEVLCSDWGFFDVLLQNSNFYLISKSCFFSKTFKNHRKSWNFDQNPKKTEVFLMFYFKIPTFTR